MRSDDRPRPSAGRGLVEALVGLALVGVVVAAAAPAWVGWRDRQQLIGAGWRIAVTVDAARLRALRDGKARGLVFRDDSGSTLGWFLARDDDGDGIRRDDLAGGRDPVEQGPFLWSRETPGVAPGVGGATRGPGSSRLPADGIAIASDLLSVAPAGTTSTGTLYLAGRGERLVALRWYGPTGRPSLWLLEPPSGRWKRLR